MREETRRLAAILAADVVGYSRLIGADEPTTIDRVRALRQTVVEPQAKAHGGRIFKSTGDGLLLEFPSAVQALRCAIAIQEMQNDSNAGLSASERLDLRIGVHQGEVVVDDDDLLGDGVIIAARLEPLAQPGGICISARVRVDAEGKLALSVEDLGEHELKNISRRIRVFRVLSRAPARLAPPLPEKPSLAVLPFTNMSNDVEQEYFADGVVEDIITALSRTGWLFVIARNSSFSYKGSSPTTHQVGRELGVRYVLEGSIRRSGGRVRINAQLVEAASGGHIWAERFDGQLVDIFELQDRITESVVGAIEPSVRRAEIARARAKPTGNLDAYDLYLRAMHQCYAMTKESMTAAVAFLRQALDIDPEYASARGFLAFVYCVRDALGHSELGDREAATILAREALAADDANPATLRAAGHALCHFGADYAGAFAALNRALSLHPSSVHVLLSLGMLNCWVGDPEAAIDYMQRAMRISPRDHELGHMLAGVGAALLRCNRNEEAVAVSYQTVGEMPNFMPGHRNLIHALVRLGREDEARAAAARLLATNPLFRIAHMTRPFRDRNFVEDYLAAMRSVGLPE